MKTDAFYILEKNVHVTAILRAVVDDDKVRTRRYTLKEMMDALFKGGELSVSELVGMVYLIAANAYHQEKVAAKTDPKKRNIRLLPLSVVGQVKRQRNDHAPEPLEGDMEPFEQFLADALKTARISLGLPEDNATEFSYPLTTAVRNAMSCNQIVDYLAQVETEGPIMSGRINEVLQELKRIDPDNFNSNESTLLEAKTRAHLSVMSIEGTGRDMAVSIVNPYGRMIRLSIRRFELLVENLDVTRSLGDLVREIEKGDFRQTYINTKVPNGEVVARYTSETSTLRAAVISVRKGDVEDVAEFILDADAVVCTYLAVKRLRLDYTRFIVLRDEAGSRVDFDPFD